MFIAKTVFFSNQPWKYGSKCTIQCPDKLFMSQSSYNLLFGHFDQELYFWIYGNIPAVGQLESESVDSTVSIFHEEKTLINLWGLKTKSFERLSFERHLCV